MNEEGGGEGRGEGFGVPSSSSSLLSVSFSSSSLSSSRRLSSVQAPRCRRRRALRDPPSSQCCRAVFIIVPRGFRSAVLRRGLPLCLPSVALFPGTSLPNPRSWRYSLPVAGCLQREPCAQETPPPVVRCGCRLRSFFPDCNRYPSIVDGGAGCPERGRWRRHPSEILAPVKSHEV